MIKRARPQLPLSTGLIAIAVALTDAVGCGGLAAPHRSDRASAGIVGEYLYGRAATIYGGSSEIQRNILAKTVLEL